MMNGIRSTFRSLLTGVPGLEVVGEVADQETLQARLSEQAPDVVLMYLDSELEVSSIELAYLVKTLQPASKALLLGAGQDPDIIVASLAVGADGYLPHDNDAWAEIRAVEDGLLYGLNHELRATGTNRLVVGDPFADATFATGHFLRNQVFSLAQAPLTA